MDKHINVVLASDDNYAQHVAVVTVSILKNTKFADQLHFFVLSDDISDKKIKLIKKTVEKFNAKIEFIDIGHDKLKNIYLSGHVSRAAYFRLMIADLVPEDVKRLSIWTWICWFVKIFLICGKLIFVNFQWVRCLTTG